MATTPDIETFVVALLANRLPAECVIVDPGRTVMPGPVRDQKQVGQKMIFVQASGGAPSHNNDTRVDGFAFAVTNRFERDGYEAARVLSFKVHDALHLCGKRGPFAGVSCIDIRSTTAAPLYIGPGDDDAEYWVEDFIATIEVAL